MSASLFESIEPSLYERSISLVVPELTEARRIRRCLISSLLAVSRPYICADLGIGTGRDVAAVLPRDMKGVLYGLDTSANLTAAMRRTKLLPLIRHRDLKVEILLNDFSSESAIQGIEPEHVGQVDLVTSSLAVHNLAAEQQMATFHNVSALLKSGGWFIYFDLVDHDSPHLSALALEYELKTIKENMDAVGGEARNPAWQQLKRKWLEHYVHDNSLIPLFSSTGQSVCRMLECAGLSTPNLIFRHCRATVLACTKLA